MARTGRNCGHPTSTTSSSTHAAWIRNLFRFINSLLAGPTLPAADTDCASAPARPRSAQARLHGGIGGRTPNDYGRASEICNGMSGPNLNGFHEDARLVGGEADSLCNDASWALAPPLNLSDSQRQSGLVRVGGSRGRGFGCHAETQR